MSCVIRRGRVQKPRPLSLSHNLTMTSFGWKRKSSQLSSAPAVFSPPDQDDKDKEEEEEANDPDFDWIAVAKRRRVAALEDNRTLFLRLKQEGEVLSLNCLCIFIIYLSPY